MITNCMQKIIDNNDERIMAEKICRYFRFIASFNSNKFPKFDVYTLDFR